MKNNFYCFLFAILLNSCCQSKNFDDTTHLINILESQLDSFNIKGFSGHPKEEKIIDSLLTLDPNNDKGVFYKGIFGFLNDRCYDAIPYLKSSFKVDSMKTVLYLSTGICYDRLKQFDSADYFFQKVLEASANKNTESLSFRLIITPILYGKEAGLSYLEDNKSNMPIESYMCFKNNLKDFSEHSRVDHFYPSVYNRSKNTIQYRLEIDENEASRIKVNSMSDLLFYFYSNGINAEVNRVSHNPKSNLKTYYFETIPRFAYKTDDLKLSGLKRL